jgi:hypothetical protein
MRLFCDDPELPPCPSPGRSAFTDVLIAFGCAAVAAIGTALGQEAGSPVQRPPRPAQEAACREGQAALMEAIAAIDPGNETSALVVWNGSRIERAEILENGLLLKAIREEPLPKLLVIEEVESYGMPVGREVFQTVWWTGRFAEAHDGRGEERRARMVPRRKARMHLCRSNRAGDSEIRTVLIDRFGDPGRKHAPGVLYGIVKDLWAAVAIAVTVFDECTALPLTPNVVDHREGAA